MALAPNQLRYANPGEKLHKLALVLGAGGGGKEEGERAGERAAPADNGMARSMASRRAFWTAGTETSRGRKSGVLRLAMLWAITL